MAGQAGSGTQFSLCRTQFEFEKCRTQFRKAGGYAVISVLASSSRTAEVAKGAGSTEEKVVTTRRALSVPSSPSLQCWPHGELDQV